MNSKNIFLWLLLFLGQALIIAGFILFRGERIPDNIFVLNTVISSFVYWVLFLNYRIPWIDLKDKSQKQIGALGITWFVTLFYAALAIGTMLVNLISINVVSFNYSFNIQIILHGVWLFLFSLGMWYSRHSSDKVQAVHQEQTKNRSGINDMKAIMRELKNKMNSSAGLPEDFIRRINTLEENLRFISPSANQEAHDLETSFIATVGDIGFAISDYSMNAERIENNLKNLERIYQNRKNVY